MAPEHNLVEVLTTESQKAEVETYVKASKNRSERERMADVNTVSGVFTGAYALHPFTNEKIPIWIGDYVLFGYGTGAVMAVPAHDERDYKFAKHFALPIKPVIRPYETHDFSNSAWCEKQGVLMNSDFLDGLQVKEALEEIIQNIVIKIGRAHV